MFSYAELNSSQQQKTNVTKKINKVKIYALARLHKMIQTNLIKSRDVRQCVGFKTFLPLHRIINKNPAI